MYILKTYKFLSKIGIDYFILAIISVIFIAYLQPEIGRTRSNFSLSEIANWLLVLIFFFYGLKLDLAKIKQSLSNIKLHIIIQCISFIVFPIIYFVFSPLLKNFNNEYLTLGILFLCALPSTVSSSIIMVSIAKGNIPAAIFNASISGILGIFITPIIMNFAIDTSTDLSHLLDVFTKLFFQVIFPVLLGLLLNKKCFSFTKKYSTFFKYYDQSVILLIVYSSFCDSFYEKMFSTLSIGKLSILAIILISLFFCVYLITLAISKFLNFNREDTITAQFCGSKKSLAHGAVMSKVILTNPSHTATFLLPIMIYHALQLVIISIIAKNKAKEID